MDHKLDTRELSGFVLYKANQLV